MEKFEGNSNIKKKPQPEREKLEPITTNVSVKKESEFSKFKRNFFAEDAKTVKGQVFTHVIIPGIQRLITDMVKTAIDVLIYGGRVDRDRDRRGNSSVSYSSYYEKNRQTNYPQTPRNYDKNAFIPDEVVLYDRGETEEVLMSLNDQIAKFGAVSIADFYDMIGQSAPYTATRYGWRDLRDAEVVRNGNGYSIDFPKAIQLD